MHGGVPERAKHMALWKKIYFTAALAGAIFLVVTLF
jgi:hypothetical protein